MMLYRKAIIHYITSTLRDYVDEVLPSTRGIADVTSVPKDHVNNALEICGCVCLCIQIPRYYYSKCPFMCQYRPRLVQL